MSLKEFLAEWNSVSPYVEVHTSGSTGQPKTMLVEKRRMLNSARITNDFLGLKPGDTALLCMSLDYIAGKMMVVRALERGLKLMSVEPSGHPMRSLELRTESDDSLELRTESDDSLELRTESLEFPTGLQTGSEQASDPSADSRAVANSQFSVLNSQLPPLSFSAMVPMQVYNSLQVPEERERLRQIRHLIIGGGAIDEALEAELKDFPNAVWSTYGMTETLSHIALRRLSGPDASEWYTPFDSVHVSLNDDHCLVIDAPAVSPDPIVTNDIAELKDQSSVFKILGRRDNTICSGGIKIQAEQLERQLRPHLPEPYLVTKHPDPKFGEIVVLLTEGDTVKARTVCERVLPKYHQPRAYVHVDRIPLTPTGKPARKEAEHLARP